MKQEELKQYIKDGKSTREICKATGKSQTTVRYWLGKFNLKTDVYNPLIRPTENTRVCPKCTTAKTLDNFYSRRGAEGTSVYCKPCTNSQSVTRQQEFKLKCIEYKGSQCELCKYNKYPGALEFHHINPKEKDFEISRCKSYTFDETIIKELDKCALLCSNCHKEVHGNIATLSG